MRFAVAAAAGIALFAAAALAPQSDLKIIYPSNLSVHAAPAVVIIAAPTSVRKVTATVDGKPLPLRHMTFDPDWVTPTAIEALERRIGDRQGKALWVGRVAGPGRHVIAVNGSGTKKVMVATTRAPAPWKRAYTHPAVRSAGDALGCAGCHKSAAGGALGAARTPNVCAPCHTEADVQLAHKHVAQPLARCGMCHDPHGAARERLLVEPKEKLCIRCHSAGHSKG